MTQVFSDVYQRLLIIKGVNYGLIGTDDLSLLIRQFCIPKAHIPELLTYLKDHGLEILSEEEKSALLVTITGNGADEESSQRSRYERFDPMLDSLLTANIDEAIQQEWLMRLYKLPNQTLRSVAFMKIAGMSANDIAAQLEISRESVYLYEHKILEHYRRTHRAIAHQRVLRARRRAISDFYKSKANEP